ncbi:hypothetical protein TraAM80_07727 [Trypanosoma rangeli]|uniref:Uncharacterized protein n=1 Tax=Trypanosoma rangeli TaxID=5698 RepID=A0A422N424_TRYRA|nr:uncharacterized protein TraAM80_07727 [Trypanosoma rangeli]RNF00218.1 hypothetical protein TraAM80_07727 [Trypanosoma rangeli]|eukprot:RNF00218.1 hypothetical protein TraAM80_07727 [Trypanosoma rangeli]
MSSEAVKKQILNAISALNIPLARLPGGQKVADACSAAKLLRNRVLREHARVEENIEALRQKQLYDDSDSDGENEKKFESENMGFSSDVRKLARQDFIFISEMMVMENVVIPLLLAHGMNFTSTLLPQLLKLLTAMLLPVPLYSMERPRQLDFVRRLMERCGTNEFFTLLIQSVAPVAEKRSSGVMQKDDVVLLEVVLKMITLFFTGPKETMPPVIGAFARNHGIELFLVIINQNYARSESKKVSSDINTLEGELYPNSDQRTNNASNVVFLDDSNEKEVEMVVLGEEIAIELDDKQVRMKQKINNDGVEDGDEEGDEEEEADEEGTEGESYDSDASSTEENQNVLDQYNAHIIELLECDEQLWKWNMHIVTAMSAILRSANPVELAQLGFASKFQQQFSQQMVGLFESGKRLRECKRELDRWRHVAKSCNGAISSNGVLVRGTSSYRMQGEIGAMGCTSTLLGLRSKDPLEKVQDIDLRKKGRFIKGISDDSNMSWILPLPTKIQLSQQCLSFICFGFEPLNMMVWSRLAHIIEGFDSVVRERNELISGYKTSGEDIELPTQIEKSVLESAQTVLDYINICASLLRYTREVVRLNREENDEVPSDAFHQQWKCISSVISLDHIRYGFELLRVFLASPDLRRRFDVVNVITYLAELFMTLNLLIDGYIVKDTAVVVAAHALASSVLYNEGNITLIFESVSRFSAKVLPPGKAGIIVLLVYSVLSLMEKCSFRGSVLFPKREKKNDSSVKYEAEDTGNADILEMNRQTDVDGLNPSEEMQNRSGDEENPIVEVKESEVVMASPVPLFLKDVHVNQEVVISPTGEERGTLSENASLTSSSHANFSTLSSEREVSIANYFKRIATTKNMRVILASLRHWRANDVDVNSGLVYLIRAFLLDGSGCVFFNAPFLLIMRDILTHGEHSHYALYRVCDQVVYDFFNPSFAKFLDEKRGAQHDFALPVLGGAQSFLGFEVSLRCVRSLFNLAFTDYSILEEKGLPHLADSTVIPLMHEAHTDEEAVHDTSSLAQVSPVKKRRRNKRVSLPENDENIDGKTAELFPVDFPIEVQIEKHIDEVTSEEFKV